MIHHPTDKCYVLKDRIQALIDAGVLTLKTEQKKVTANMVTLEFGKTTKVTVPDGTYSVPVPRLEVKHPPTKTQDNKGLVPLTLETGERDHVCEIIRGRAVEDQEERLQQPRA